MNVKVVLIVLAACLSLQEVAAQKVEFELFVRPALTSLRGNDLIKENFEPTINLSGGVGLNVFVTANSVINFGVLYDRKGARGHREFDLRDQNNMFLGRATLTNICDLTYITVPVQYGYRFGRKFQYQVGAGFYGSFLIAAETGSKIPGVYDVREHNTEDYKSVDAGVLASFNMFVPAGKRVVFRFGVDNYLGLVNVGEDMGVSGGTLKHNSLGLTVGIKCPLGHNP